MRKLSLLTILISLGVLSSAFAQQADCRNCIVIYGDSRTNHEIHQKITDAIMKINPSVVFHTGDMVEDGSKQGDWDIFGRITEPLRKKAEFYPVMGNHEKNAKIPFLDPKMFEDKTWYSLERCGMHFIVLDSNCDLSVDSTQYIWLETELKRMREDKKPIIVLMHNPIFSVGKFANAGSNLKDSLAPLFEKYRVTAVFSGHDHNYQRFLYRRIYYIVTGGGGAPLHWRSAKSRFNQKFIEAHHFCTVSIIKNRLAIGVYDIDSKLIDRFEIKLRR